MDLIWIMLIGFAVLVAVALFAAAIVTFFLRVRARERLTIDLGLLLRLYLYVAIIAGLLVLIQGTSSLLKAGMAAAWDNEFSYTPVFVVLPEDKNFDVPHPLELRDRSTLTPAELNELSRILAEREQKRTALEDERRDLGLERAQEEGLIEGVSLGLIGALIVGVHLIGKRMLKYKADDGDALGRTYLIAGTVVFGVLAIVSLPQAVFDSLRYVLIDTVGPLERDYRPGGKLALSIAALPAWLTFFWLTIQSVRQLRDKPDF